MSFFITRHAKSRFLCRLMAGLILLAIIFTTITYSYFQAQVQAQTCNSVVAATAPAISAPSAILMEASTGIVIYEKEADVKLRPASITKIMTLILIFDALAEGKITLDEKVTGENVKFCLRLPQGKLSLRLGLCQSATSYGFCCLTKTIIFQNSACSGCNFPRSLL